MKNNNNIAICIAAFNRPESLNRILKSLSMSNYDNDKVTLYISIDKAKEFNKDNEECVSIAKKFIWKFGDKIVDYKTENLGLRKHILSCGNLTNKFDNIIMLEDDILVSQNFYIYAKNVLEHYKNDTNIAGFGLYSFQKCPQNNLPFYPLQTEYDVFFMQYACSWGQMWTKKQWNDFYNWYEINKDKDLHSDNFPNYIANWPKSSWLKYYMKYLTESNKFFIYPYNSYTTNFTDIGTHNKTADIAYQTILSNRTAKNLNFCTIDETLAVYDIFFENLNSNKIMNIPTEITTNFYNCKENFNTNYLLTREKLNYKIVKSFGLLLYPYENNLIYEIEGNDIFLYNITSSQKNKIINSFDFINYIYRVGRKSKREYFIYLKDIFIKLFKK